MALIINSEEIDDEIIEAEFRQIKSHYERTLQVSCCERDPEFRGYAKDNIISRVLLNQAALSRFPEIEPDAVTERLGRLMDEAGGETQFYVNIGMPVKDEEIVRQNVANGVRLDRMLAQVYQPEPEPTDEEIRAWYEAHLELFMTDEHIRAAHITKGLQGARTRQEIYTRMRELRRELLGGVDFMELAERERSEEQQQIDLGWFKRGEFMEDFEVIAFSMNIGEISPVFTTQLGFHLCTVLGRREPEPKPFEEVREDARQRIVDEHRDARFSAFLEELKAAAAIEDNEPEEEDWSSEH